jgi:hypothetical protein
MIRSDSSIVAAYQSRRPGEVDPIRTPGTGHRVAGGNLGGEIGGGHKESLMPKSVSLQARENVHTTTVR